MRHFFYILVIISSALSCKLSHSYIPDEERFYTFVESYSSLDTLNIENFIMYGSADMGGLHDPWRKVDLNSDSLIQIFKKSISHIKGINLHFNDSLKNKKNSSHYANPSLQYKKIDKEAIISLASKDNNSTSLIPVIQFAFNASRWSGSGQFDTYPTLICHFNIAIFIVKNQDIIYSKQMRYVEKVDGEFYPYIFEDFYIPIPQLHWDGLVREVMKEYIERMVWKDC